MIYRLGSYFFLSIFLAALFLPGHDLRAEFYKYIDKNGTLRFVDDPAKIPPEYRKSIKTYEGRYDHLSEEEKLNLVDIFYVIFWAGWT